MYIINFNILRDIQYFSLCIDWSLNTAETLTGYDDSIIIIISYLSRTIKWGLTGMIN